MYNNYKMKRKEGNIFCPYVNCSGKFDTESEMYRHFVREHQDFTEKLLDLSLNTGDLSGFTSYIRREYENMRSNWNW
jgi:hypothetical protein